MLVKNSNKSTTTSFNSLPYCSVVPQMNRHILLLQCWDTRTYHIVVRKQMKHNQLTNIFPKQTKPTNIRQIALIHEFFSIVRNGKPSSTLEFCEVHLYHVLIFEKVFVALLLVSKISGFKAEKQKRYQLQHFHVDSNNIEIHKTCCSKGIFQAK